MKEKLLYIYNIQKGGPIYTRTNGNHTRHPGTSSYNKLRTKFY